MRNNRGCRRRGEKAVQKSKRRVKNYRINKSMDKRGQKIRISSNHRISIQQLGKRGGGRLFFIRIEPN